MLSRTASRSGADSQRQIEILAGQADLAQNLVQVPDVRGGAYGFVTAKMVQPQFELPLFADGFLHAHIDPVID